MTDDVKPYLDDKLGRDRSRDEPRRRRLRPRRADLCRRRRREERSTDLGKFKDKFDGKIYGIEPGNDGNRIILDMIDEQENGLDGFELVESSEAGMLAQAEQSMKNKEWIVFLGWTPHPMMGEMKITYLDGMGDIRGFGAATVLHQRAQRLHHRMPERRQVHRQPEVQPATWKTRSWTRS